MHAIVVCLLVVVAALLFTAALHDAAFRTIPNQLTIVLALCGIILRAVEHDLGWALLAAFLVFAAASFCWRRGWMGGGDVKLLAAVALVAAPGQVPVMIAWIAIAGGVLTLPYLIARRRLMVPSQPRPRRLLARLVRAERWRLRRGGPLPYAVAIAAGAGAVLLQGVPS